MEGACAPQFWAHASSGRGSPQSKTKRYHSYPTPELRQLFHQRDSIRTRARPWRGIVAIMVCVNVGCSPATAPLQTVAQQNAPFEDLDRQWRVAHCAVSLSWEGPGQPPSTLRAWIDARINAVAALGDGRLPVSRLHVRVRPVDRGERAIAFGMVRRHPIASIELLLNKEATDAQLADDWVFVHELSHLWLPRLRGEDAWFTEGVATYLQEVLRARVGLITPEQAWANLEAGFVRGSRAGTGRRLADEARLMHRTAAYHRVYWAGAAFALRADVTLRQQDSSILAAIRNTRTAIDQGRLLATTAHDVIAHWEQSTGVTGLTKLADDSLAQTDLSPPDATLRALGPLRTAIMSAP